MHDQRVRPARRVNEREILVELLHELGKAKSLAQVNFAALEAHTEPIAQVA